MLKKCEEIYNTFNRLIIIAFKGNKQTTGILDAINTKTEMIYSLDPAPKTNVYITGM